MTQNPYAAPAQASRPTADGLPGRLISSRATFFYKRIFIALWFGFLFVCAAVVLSTTLAARASFMEIAAGVGVPIAVMVLGYTIFRITIMDVVDEVYDAVDALIVRNGGHEERIPLADIRRAKGTLFVNPERVILELAHDTRFGSRIAFLPPIRWIRLVRNPLAAELEERAGVARRAPA